MNSFLEKAKNRVAADNHVSEVSNHDIAVIGIDGVFPKAEGGIWEFWDQLSNSRDCRSDIPPFRRYDVDEYLPIFLNQNINASPYRKMGYLDRIDLFDPLFFALSKRESELMDPNHKLLLETAWRCIENAGYGSRISATKTGVFVGYSDEPYYKQVLSALALSAIDPTVTDFVRSAIAGRISYLLNLTGPSLVIDTACSSSLTAVHYACQSLRNNECSMAVVASAKIVLFPFEPDRSNKTESRDGVTHAFDERAQGMGVGEGAASILLKPMNMAVRDQDFIYAVIQGSAVNQDGKTNGFTSPNPQAQADVILSAWKNARVHPQDISYIEAHGSATQLGDSIEIEGIKQAFERHTPKKQFCAIGSVKANIGHLDHAAGLAGLIKVILMLNRKQIPPQAHFKYPNQKIPFHNTPVYVNDTLSDWVCDDKPRICGINSFGLTGANCHLVVREADRGETGNDYHNNTPYLFTLTAHSRPALRRQISILYSYVRENPSISIQALCYTSNVGKRLDRHRIAFIVRSIPELLQAMLHYRDAEIPQIDKGIYISGPEPDSVNLMLDENSVEEQDQRLTLLHRLAEAYTRGAQVNFYDQFPSLPKIVPLPSDPFDRECCWIHPSDFTQLREEGLFHAMKWQACPLEKWDANNKAWENPAFLIIGDDSILSGIDDKNATVFTARFTDAFTKIGDTQYTIDGTLEGFERLLDAIQTYSIMNVVYLPPPISDWTVTSDTLDNQYEKYINYFIFFYKALRNQINFKRCNLFCVVQNADRITRDDQQVSPMHRALLEMVHAVATEDSAITCRCIDVDGVLPFADLLDECRDKYTNMKVAYRKGSRYIPYIAPATIVEHANPMLPVKSGGVYVIVGGTGGIGLELANQLSQEHIVTVLLLGSRDRTRVDNEDVLYDEVLLGMRKIEDNGSKAQYYQADITDRNVLSRVLDSIRSRYGKIDGIIHSAGVNVGLGGTLLKNADTQKIRRDMAVKIDGTVHLDLLTRRDKLDFFILMTSPITWVGGVAISDYMASNAFQSSYAIYRNSIGFPTKTIGWAPWYHALNRQGEIYDEERQLFKVLTQRDIHIGWSKAFGLADIEVTVGRINFSDSVMLLDGVLFRFLPETVNKASMKQGVLRESLPDIPYTLTGRQDDQYTQTERDVAQAWCNTLGTQNVDLYDNFFDKGGHSILAIKFEVELKERIAYTDIYMHPTVASLAKYIDADGRNNDHVP